MCLDFKSGVYVPRVRKVPIQHPEVIALKPLLVLKRSIKSVVYFSQLFSCVLQFVDHAMYINARF